MENNKHIKKPKTPLQVKLFKLRVSMIFNIILLGLFIIFKAPVLFMLILIPFIIYGIYSEKEFKRMINIGYESEDEAWFWDDDN